MENKIKRNLARLSKMIILKSDLLKAPGGGSPDYVKNAILDNLGERIKESVEAVVGMILLPRVSALFVETNGCYYNLAGVDPWDESRDARDYIGPSPVVAHPPCQRWGKMWAGQPLTIKKTGIRKKKGDDNGCFESALSSVRKYGGVIEHPWGSHAWPHFGLERPPRSGGWIKADDYGYTCCVEQGRYGHYAPKPTMLYAVGCELPDLDWGIYKVKESDFPAWAIEKHGIKKCRRAGLLAFKGGGKDSSPRIGTPEKFRDVLLKMARSVGGKND